MATATTTLGWLPAIWIFVLVCTEGTSEPWLKSEKFAELGTEVQLPCVLKSPQCEGLHSVKWYRGTTRIFIFSEDTGITRGNNDIAARSDIQYSANSTKTYLKIPEVKLEDEGLYKCEATYLAINPECNNVQHIILNVTVQPPYVRVIDQNTKKTLSEGATLGPINEGSMISLYCETGESKPVPTIEWFKGDERLESTDSPVVGENGVGTGSSTLEMQITRDELGAKFTCKVSSIALDEPMTVNIMSDVHVRPQKMDLNGVVGHVVKGTKILLQCIVKAARPPANVTWYNGTNTLFEGNERFDMFETKVLENDDGTAETTSYLAFTASEYDNGETFHCHAENSVTRTEDLKPMKESTTIEVLYPPNVKIKPTNITVNESDDFVIFCDYEANPASLLKVTWYQDDKELNLNSDHYDGGTPEQTALTVKNATSTDMGIYKCSLENSIDVSFSEETVQVSVFYKPVVEVIMDPDTPVNEADHLNVSLSCEIISGNPPALTAVRWYLDGDLLKELPDCSRNNSQVATATEESLTFCDIDPSKLLLEAVGRSFHGNYSCEGKNDAGWGPMSPTAPVTVHYKPGPASIFYEPRQVVKKGPLVITCYVLDPGRPPVSGFKWLRGLHKLPRETESVLRIESVNLETEANFTCMAYNDAGDGDTATTFIDVSAPPAFIKKLHPYHGYVYNSPNVSIMCWVECAPICNISWLKNGIPMNFSKTNRYYVSTVYHPPDTRTNDFESVQSTLFWNLTAWPDGQLDRIEDNAKFTCESTGNGVGIGVKSSTHFHVEFPPENMTVSKEIINVVMDTIPEKVTCNAKAHPEPNFRWFREGSTDTIVEGRNLDLKMPIPRRSNGTYYCEASNRHGKKQMPVVMNVQFKPECYIEKERLDGEDYVVCIPTANPKETDFSWSLKDDNDTLDQTATTKNGKSYILIDSSVSNFRTYVCIANNSIGFSAPCERGIPGSVAWWHYLEGNILLIIIIAVVIIIIIMIILCVVIFIICRRKRSQMKYSNRVVELEEREHPDGGPPSPTVSSHSNQAPVHHSTAVPKWPLKPGVLVHINRAHSLRSGLSIRTNESLHNELMPKASTDRLTEQCDDDLVAPKPPIRIFRLGKDIRAQRMLGMTGLHDESMLARANKIKAMFSMQLKEQHAIPGISREKTAVTYKKITPRPRVPNTIKSSSQQTVCSMSRKRKKPGADPNQTVNNNHVDSVSEGLHEPGTKTFYENLPFHGIQSPPNKLVSPKFARVSALHGNKVDLDSGSRDRSSNDNLQRHSISRYESTKTTVRDARGGRDDGVDLGELEIAMRSHLGPHYSDYNMPRNNSPVLKYNTLKPRRRKHKHSHFYSLRLCRKHETASVIRGGHSDHRKKYELYAVPIYKSCPHRSSSTNSVATIIRSLDDSDSLTLRQSASFSLIRSSTSSLRSMNEGSPERCEVLSQSPLLLLPPPPPPPPILPPSPPRSPRTSPPSCPPVPAPRAFKRTDPSKHTYQNVPFVFAPSPNYASLPKTKTDNLYNYEEHYQQQQQHQHQQQQQQQQQQHLQKETQQYSYQLPNNSSSQLTLSLTRSLYHSSIVSPAQASPVPFSSNMHSNRSSPTEERENSCRPSAIDHRDIGQEFVGAKQQEARQARRSAPSRRNDRNRKHRKQHERNDRKQKQTTRRAEARRGGSELFSVPACETPFHQIFESPKTETYKISYPHYYEDEIAECPPINAQHSNNSSCYRQRVWGRQSSCCHANGKDYADPEDARNQSKKRLSSSMSNARSSANVTSTPTIMQYAELHFRDVGQEIDV